MKENDEKTNEVKKKRQRGVVFIKKELCKGCGFCVEFCPFDVLEMSDEFNEKGYHPPKIVNIEVCTGCDLCGMYCPDFAIYGRKLKIEELEGELVK